MKTNLLRLFLVALGAVCCFHSASMAQVTEQSSYFPPQATYGGANAPAQLPVMQAAPYAMAYAPVPGYFAAPTPTEEVLAAQAAFLSQQPTCGVGGCDTGCCDAPGPACGCDAGGCDSGCCGAGGYGAGCCMPEHRLSFFGEYLYLRPRHSEIQYAVEENGPITAPPSVPVQTSRIGMVDQDYDSGFRAGFGYCLDGCSSIRGSYTMFEADTRDSINNGGDPALAIFPMVAHPSTLNAAATGTFANAYSLLSMDLIDIDYRRIIRQGCNGSLNWVAGIRYANLEQEFSSNFQILGDGNVTTDVDFDGLGIRLGLEGEAAAMGNVSFYGRGIVSVLGGEFNATFVQTEVAQPTLVDTSWEAGRLVPVLDLEFGLTWQHPCKRLSMSAGYMISTWFNTVKTDEWIDGVQKNSFENMDGSLTFDGVVARIEARY